MDPDQTLRELRALLRDTIVGLEQGDMDDMVDLLADWHASFDALDEWLSKGGFLPSAWQVDPRPTIDLLTRAATRGE